MRKYRKRKKSEGPFFKPGGAARLKTSKLTATSHATGISHEFTNVAGWEKIIADLESAQAIQDRDILSSLSFYNWLRQQKINKSHLSIKYSGPGFRYSNPKYGPLTIVGSVGDGGRFNPGSAQMHVQFPYVTKFGCLYLSSSRECAEAEAAKPIGCHRMYEVRPNNELLLWDLSAVIGSLNYTSLLETIRASFGDRLWCYQKSPLPSQILALKLKLEGGNGISFESTKTDGHHNVALFFDTDEDAKAALTFREI